MTDLPAPSREASALELVISCVDLTSLEGDETPEQAAALCEKAVRPDPADPGIPGVAAVVLYPPLVAVAADSLKGTSVKVATVIGFPVPDEPLPKRLAEIHAAVDAGAEEIDIVLDREAFMSGRKGEAGEEISRAKDAAGPAILKVILETGGLRSGERIREAAALAMSAGADFLKSSTGKTGTGATPEAAVAMMEAVRVFHERGGRAVGVKLSGGIRSTDQAMGYVDMLEERLGRDWLSPDRFRIGASALLDDLVVRVRQARTG